MNFMKENLNFGHGAFDPSDKFTGVDKKQPGSIYNETFEVETEFLALRNLTSASCRRVYCYV